MKQTPNLIVMLTHNDVTVENAPEIFAQCQDSKAQFWGMKEEGLSLEQMKQLYARMRACGKTTFLEVVAYTEKAGLAGAEIAAACGCDILMGTLYFDSIHQFCKEHQMKYMPFVGRIHHRPSILEGTVQEMVAQAKEYIQKGVYGIDLLGYRYRGDAVLLNKTIVHEVDGPVCIAGSIDSFQRLDEVKGAAPWAFTIGSAFFEQKFSGTFCEQIDCVCDYMKQ